MDEPVPLPAAGDAAPRRFLTFRLDDAVYALHAADVREVVRVPALARMPQSPPGLLGLANLRGTVLPVASLRGLLGRPAGDPAKATQRAIVLTGSAPVAVQVDAVDALVSVPADAVETLQAHLAAAPGEQVTGAFRTGPGQAVAKILDMEALLRTAFVARARNSHAPAGRADAPEKGAGQEAAPRQVLVTFAIAGQEYAFALSEVREIVPLPADVAVIPRSEDLLLGITSVRETLLPLLSLRGLLGFPPAAGGTGHEKVVITLVGGVLVGLVVDAIRSILAVDPALVEPAPAVLAARSGGEARISAIYRGEGGRRLVSILTPALIFREDVMQRLSQDLEPAAAPAPAPVADEVPLLVFRLGDDEFGLPIAAVSEVAPLPAQITRLPKAPKFLEGVINLRGEVLPVVDQRRRFDMPKLAGATNRRLIVVRTAQHRAGLIVDGVSQVLRVLTTDIAPAPDLSGEAARLVNGVVNLAAAGRMILLLDPAELLSRSERGLLDAFAAGRKAS